MLRPLTLVPQEDRKLVSIPSEYTSHISTFAYMYLQENGWFDPAPCDDEGYTPWYTFPSIPFIKDILDPDFKVLEYGCGYSSLFYKNRVKELTVVEHDEDWAKKVLEIDSSIDIMLVKANAEAHPAAGIYLEKFSQYFPQIRSENYHHDLIHGLVNMEFGGYASVVFEKPKGYYDVIVIDGMARALTGYMAADMVSENGYLILDNSDRWHYNMLQEYLIARGFGRVDFWGPGHSNHGAWCTSIFSKNFKVKNRLVHRQQTQAFITI